MSKTRQTHFYYMETVADKRGNILTACNKHVSLRYDIDLHEPSCEICRQLMEDYDRLRIE